MALVTGGMGGLGSICSFLCAQEGMGPVMTTSRTGAIPGGQTQVFMLEGIMGYCPHISIKCDMSQSSTVADLFAWCQKMGKTGVAMQQQVLNIDAINGALKEQMGYEKRKASAMNTLELMEWIRDRYAKSLADLKKQIQAGKQGKSKKEMEDELLNLQDADTKVRELIAQISDKFPGGGPISETSLRQVRQKAAQLSETVADIEKMSNPARRAALEKPLSQQEDVSKQTSSSRMQDLIDRVSQLKLQKGINGREWVVIGGGQTGGVIAQLDCEPESEECDDRLATGARVEEVKIQNGKILYKKIEGDGPQCGWVSLVHQGQALLVEVNETELE